MYYDFEWEYHRGFLDNPLPPGPQWLSELLGMDFLADVVLVDAQDSGLRDDDLRHVEQLPRLQFLNLTGTSIGNDGCAHFAGCKHLLAVHLGRTRISDAGLRHLAGLTQLDWTFLGHTQITDEGMRHLASLTRLRELNVFGTQVTPQGVAPLIEANPQLRVIGASSEALGAQR